MTSRALRSGTRNRDGAFSKDSQMKGETRGHSYSSNSAPAFHVFGRDPRFRPHLSTGPIHPLRAHPEQAGKLPAAATKIPDPNRNRGQALTWDKLVCVTVSGTLKPADPLPNRIPFRPSRYLTHFILRTICVISKAFGRWGSLP
jgi:hypothetical protein